MEEEYLNIGGIYSPRGMKGLTRQDYLDWESENALILQDNQIPKEQWEDYFVASKMRKFFPKEDKTFWDGYTLDQLVLIYNSRVLELANAVTRVNNDDSGLFKVETEEDRKEINIEDPDDLEYLALSGQYRVYNSIFGPISTYKTARDAESFSDITGYLPASSLQNEYDRLLHKSYSAQQVELMKQIRQNIDNTEDPQKTKDQLRTEILSIAQLTSPYYRYYHKKLLDAFIDDAKKMQDLELNPNDKVSQSQKNTTSTELSRWQNLFTDLDWDDMSLLFIIDSQLHGKEYAVRHLNERILNTVDDEISFFEKMEKGFIGGNIYQTAGALILGVGLIAGLVETLNPENRDENLSTWLNYWYNVVNNSITLYGNDVSLYGAFIPDRINEWKEIGIGRYQITAQAELDNGGFVDLIVNENLLPNVLSLVGFTNAAALESRLFSWAGRRISNMFGKKALNTVTKRIAQTNSAALGLSKASRKGFLDTWETWMVPALTTQMESLAEATEVANNVITLGDLMLNTLKELDFQETFKNEYDAQFQKVKDYYMQQPYANNSNTGVYVRISLKDGTDRYEYLKPKEEWAEEQAANYLSKTENLLAIADDVNNALDGKYKPYESEIKAETAKAAWGTFYRNFGVQFVLNTTLEKAIQAPSVRERLDARSPFRKFNAEGTPGNMKVSSRYTTGRQVWDIAKIELGESIEEYWQTINEEASAAKGIYNIEKYIDNMYNGDQMMQIGDNAAGATKKFWSAAGETALSNLAFVAAAYGGFGAMLGTAKFNGYRTVMRNPDGSIVTDDKGNPIMGLGRTYKEDGKRESIWDVMVRWSPWETGIGRDIRYTNLKKKGLLEEADRIRTYFNNPDNADKLKDDLAALEFAKEVAEEDRDQLDLATSANGQYVAMWNYLNKIKGTSAYNQLKSKLDILSGEAAREEIGEAESERLINSYVEHMKKGEDREENQDKSVEEIKQLLRENAKTIKAKFDKISEYSKFVDKNFGLIDDDVKKALVWGYMNIDDAKTQLDEVTEIINSTKHGTTSTLSTISEDLWEDYAKHTASKKGIERVEETLQKYIQKRDLARQKLENVKGHSSRKSRNSIKEEIKAWDRVIEKLQKALNKLKSDIHYSLLEKLIDEKSGVISAEDIMRLDPESRWLLINNAKEYSKAQQTEIKKLLKVNNPQAFKKHLLQAALAYSAIRQITENITKATSDPDYYNRYVLQVKTLALYNTSRNVIKKINEIPDYDNFVKALNETMELAKNKPEALYYQMELSRLANSEEGSEHLKKYMRELKKLSEVIDVLLEDSAVKKNSDLNERTLLGLFWQFMTNEKKVDVDLVTDKDIKDHFDEFRAYVEKWNSEQDELNKVSLDVYSDPIASLQSAFTVAKDSYQAVLDDKKMKEEIPLVDSDAGLDLNGLKLEPTLTSREDQLGRELVILINTFYDSAIRLITNGLNILVEENQEEKLQTLNNELKNQLMDIVRESVKGAEDIDAVIMNLIGFLNTISDNSIVEALKSIIKLANETTPESIRHQKVELSDIAISSMDMVKVLSTKAPAGSIDEWVLLTYEGVEAYLRDRDIRAQSDIFYLVSPEVAQRDNNQTDLSKKVNEDTLPIMMCVVDRNGKHTDANGIKYQVIGFLPYGTDKAARNIGVIKQIRKIAFEQYNLGIKLNYSHPVLNEYGEKISSKFERLDEDIPLNGQVGGRMRKFPLRDVLHKIAHTSSLKDERFRNLVKKVIKGIRRDSLDNGHYMLVYLPTLMSNGVYLFVKRVSDTVNLKNQNLADVINKAVESNLFGFSVIDNFNSLTHDMCNHLLQGLQKIYSETEGSSEDKDNLAMDLLKQLKYFINWPDGWNFTVTRTGNIVTVALQSPDTLASYKGNIELMRFNALDATTIDQEAIKTFMTNLFTEEDKEGKRVIRQGTVLERPMDTYGIQNDFIIWQINYYEAEHDSEAAANRMESYLRDDLLEINQDFLDKEMHGVSVSSPFKSSDKPYVKELGDTSEMKPFNDKGVLELMKESALKKLRKLRRGTELAKDESCYIDGKEKEYSRVTSLISDFDLDSPYARPSTTIGNVFDAFVRDFFSGKIALENGKIKTNVSLKYVYPNASEQELSALADQLNTLKLQLLADGITILTPDEGEQFTIAGRLTIGGEEKDVAGTMDLVGIDKYGRIHIFDMKTFRVLNVNDNSEVRKAILERETKWKKQLTLYTRLVSLKIDDNPPFEVASINIIPIAVSYPAPSLDNEYRVDEGSNQLYYNNLPITNTSPKLISTEIFIGTRVTDRFYIRESEATETELNVADQIKEEEKNCRDSDGLTNGSGSKPGSGLSSGGEGGMDFDD